MSLGPSLRYGIPVTILATVVLCAMAFNIPTISRTTSANIDGPTVSFVCDEVPLNKAAELFSRASGRQVLLTHAVSNIADAALVTVNYEGVPWRDALAHLARTAGCIAIEDPTEAHPTYHLAPYEQQLRGDANGDGVLGINDFVELTRQIPWAQGNPGALDVNHSGNVDLNDSVSLIHQMFSAETPLPVLFPQYTSIYEDDASAYERGATLARSEVQSGSYRIKMLGLPAEQLCEIQEQLDYFVELDSVAIYTAETQMFVKGYNEVVRDAFKSEFGEDVMAWISSSVTEIDSSIFD